MLMICERKNMSKMGEGIKMIDQRIRIERIKLGLTQKELADRLAVSPGAVGMYEQGRRIPEVHIIEKMADLFDCTVDYLLGRTNEKDEYIAVINDAKNNKVTPEQLSNFIDFLKKQR